MQSQGPVRGEKDVEITVEEIEDDVHVEYIERDNTVRYVAGWRHTNHQAVTEEAPPEREPIFETTPFERWAESRCLTVAGRSAVSHVQEELDTGAVDSGMTLLGDGDIRAAVVVIETTLDQTGEVVHALPVEFDALVAATPATVDVTYHLGDHEYGMDVPVYARHDVVELE